MAPSRKRRRLSHESELETASNETNRLSETPKQRQEQQQRKSLFVRSLPPSTTTADLLAHFSQSFPIKHATAVVDRATQQCKGFGFITFADPEDAQRAIEELDNTNLGGQRIKLEVAEPRHREYDDAIPVNDGGRAKFVNVPTGAAAEARAKREAERKEALAAPSTRLIIRNLPWSIKSADQLALLFRSYGKIKNASLPAKKPGLLSGFGFVTVRGRKNAEKAIDGVNGKEVDGRTLAVDWAVTKDEWDGLHNGEAKVDDTSQNAVDSEQEFQGFDGDDDDDEKNDDDGEPVLDEQSEASDDIDMAGVDEDGGIDEAQDAESVKSTRPTQDYSSTLFIRNLPFSSSDDSLHEHFSHFGRLRYARVVIDRETERPKGTGFVCFFKSEDSRRCLRGAPTFEDPSRSSKTASKPSVQSLLRSELDDPSGQYTMEGRVLHVSKAVDRSEAARLTEEGVSRRGEAEKDKRRLYLLSEGTISPKSPLYHLLSSTETSMREASAKQRKALIQSNPSLHLSLTRLSIRNIPRSITSKDLKSLAREAVVGFAKDVKEGKRQRLSREELSRGGEEMSNAEKMRKERGTGIVKQAKVVFESREGGKVAESSGGGRSRGYGFIEYHSHRLALMGLRWLNGHAIDYKTKEDVARTQSKDEQMDRKKRLIVEFAIENAQVVRRRSEKEQRQRTKLANGSGEKDDSRPRVDVTEQKEEKKKPDKAEDKLAKRQRIIAKKRAAKRAKRSVSNKS